MRFACLVVAGALLAGCPGQVVYPSPGTTPPLNGTAGAQSGQIAPGAGARVAVPRSPVPPVRPGMALTRWEYLCIDAMYLDEAGMQGWELVSTVPVTAGATGNYGSISTSVTYCLKRPLPGTSPDGLMRPAQP